MRYTIRQLPYLSASNPHRFCTLFGLVYWGYSSCMVNSTFLLFSMNISVYLPWELANQGLYTQISELLVTVLQLHDQVNTFVILDLFTLSKFITQFVSITILHVFKYHINASIKRKYFGPVYSTERVSFSE